MSYLQVIFTTKRNRKSAIAFTIIGFLLVLLIGDFAGSVVGYGITSSLFNVSNATGFILLLTDWILAIIVLLIALYHWGEKMFGVCSTLTKDVLAGNPR